VSTTGAVVVLGVAAAYAALPPTVPPNTLLPGTLVTTSLDVLSVDAFVRAITQAHDRCRWVCSPIAAKAHVVLE